MDLLAHGHRIHGLDLPGSAVGVSPLGAYADDGCERPGPFVPLGPAGRPGGGLSLGSWGRDAPLGGHVVEGMDGASQEPDRDAV